MSRLRTTSIAFAVPKAFITCSSRSASARSKIACFSASASRMAAFLEASASSIRDCALPWAEFTAESLSPSEVRIAALFFLSAAICNSIESCTALEGIMSRSSTLVTLTPQGSVAISNSRSKISLISVRAVKV